MAPLGAVSSAETLVTPLPNPYCTTFPFWVFFWGGVQI
ncbi:hypothetical protein CFP56_006542 [Quercus suber]|uniref:Uncharacterized protein n=1 Tax=Quercus suber TaxID=58331 RepID=A0AAW0L777_QUESU